MEEYSTRKFESFDRCIKDFDSVRGKEFNSFNVSAIINKFELSFDLSWKVLKEILKDMDIVCYYLGSPRENLEQGFKAGIIEDNPIWLEMLKLRNQLSHDYDLDIAFNSCGEIVNTYLPFLEEYCENIRKYFN